MQRAILLVGVGYWFVVSQGSSPATRPRRGAVKSCPGGRPVCAKDGSQACCEPGQVCRGGVCAADPGPSPGPSPLPPECIHCQECIKPPCCEDNSEQCCGAGELADAGICRQACGGFPCVKNSVCIEFKVGCDAAQRKYNMPLCKRGG